MIIKVIDLLNKVSSGDILEKNVKVRTLPLEKLGYCVMGELNFDDILNALLEGAIELNNRVEIVEEDEPIEEIKYCYKNTYGRISQHKASEIDILDKLNEVIRKVNKIE